ncbi:MAG: FAD-dependent oxidoreductase [Candidatus Krumholzibacteria bacterium]|nr:FAD-dependent oxidoreductase [Candidatus Krumholzibacteria bacterium]
MKVVIIGNGVAGVTAAETIRAKDRDAEILVVSGEPHGFYSRPRLIELLAGKASAEQITIHNAQWYEKKEIGFIPSARIERIDPLKKFLVDDSGKETSYGTLVIAAGAAPFVPPIDGASSDGVFTLRTIEDAARIRETAMGRGSAAIIGGGLLGIEAAGSLAALGVRVVLLEVSGRLLPRQLDETGSSMLLAMLEKKGISVMAGATVAALRAGAGGLEIRLEGGSSLAAGLAVISAGVRPRIDLALAASIRCGSGILVDDFMRTNLPGVYACGDCAEHDSRLYGLWQPARAQGAACGNHIAGVEAPFRGAVTSARLKVAGIELASVGSIVGAEGVRGIVEKMEDGLYRKLFIRDGRLIGAILLGDLAGLDALQKAIRDCEVFEP